MREVCIANIGRRQRRARGLAGLTSLAFAIAMVAAGLILDVPGLRFASLPFFLGGFLGVLQHREKT